MIQFHNVRALQRRLNHIRRVEFLPEIDVEYAERIRSSCLNASNKRSSPAAAKLPARR